MFKLFSGLQGKAILKFLVSNRGISEFLAPKFGLVVIATVLSSQKNIRGWLWLATLIIFLIEAGLAYRENRREFREGFSVKRARQVGLLRLGLAGSFGLLSWVIFSLLPFWLAPIPALFLLLISFGGYLALSLAMLLKDMRGAPLTQDSPIFQQVREMKHLDSIAEHLRLRLLVNKGRDERRNLTFYLGWAETYRGHQLLHAERWAKAARHYKAAIAIDPANLAARASLIISLAHQSKFELAIPEVKKAIAVFNGQRDIVWYDEALWNWQRNEVSSEHEQKAAVFQFCALLIALLRISRESGEVKELLEKEITAAALQVPGQTAEELIRIIALKGGTAPGALGLLAAGPYRAPASPLDLLEKPFYMPLLIIQTIEAAA